MTQTMRTFLPFAYYLTVAIILSFFFGRKLLLVPIVGFVFSYLVGIIILICTRLSQKRT